jgi:hypothetical protein
MGGSCNLVLARSLIKPGVDSSCLAFGMAVSIANKGWGSCRVLKRIIPEHFGWKKERSVRDLLLGFCRGEVRAEQQQQRQGSMSKDYI